MDQSQTKKQQQQKTKKKKVSVVTALNMAFNFGGATSNPAASMDIFS